MYIHEISRTANNSRLCLNLDHVVSIEHPRDSTAVYVSTVDNKEREYCFNSFENARLFYMTLVIEMRRAEKRGMDE